MLHTLALAAALSLSAGQTAPLALTNDRITFGGEFGPTRASNKLLPGDIFYLAFDIENLSRDAQSTVKYTIGIKVTDAAGKAIYAPKPAEQETILPLGGKKLPARVYFGIAPDEAKGMYNCRVSVTDRATNVTKTLDKPVEILPPAFGIVRLMGSVDEEGGIPTPFRGTEGQPFFLTFFVVGFARHPQTKQPNTLAEIRVVDQDGKPTTEKPLVTSYEKGVDPKVDSLRFLIPMPMNQAGNYTVEIKTVCRISGQSDSIKVPIRVQPVDK